MKRIRCYFCKRCCRNMDEFDVTMEELIKMYNEGVIVIDVRSPKEYREGHIKGSISIPDYELRSTIEKIINNKMQKMIVYCPSGFRSKKAQKILRRMGYVNVYNLYKGFENY